MIKVLCDDNETYAELDSKRFAESAVKNDIDFESFIYSMRNFCSTSTSTPEEIDAWSSEAVEHYLALLVEAGKLEFKPLEFQGGSDYDEVETALDDINSITNKEI